MEVTQSPANCRWGTPTLFLSPPMWLSAWDCPWTCTCEAMRGPLDTTETCVKCRYWQPLEERAAPEQPNSP